MNGAALRLGVFHLGALGDCLLALHVVRAIVRAWAGRGETGGIEVHMVARSAAARLAMGRGIVTTVEDADACGFSSLFAEAGVPTPPGLAQRIHGLHRIVSFCGGPDVAPAVRLRELARGPVWAVDPRWRDAAPQASRHITEQWGGDLREQGCEVAALSSEPLIRLRDDEVSWGSSRWREAFDGVRAACAPTSDRVLIHPGSGGRSKCWPVERFEELAAFWTRAGRQVVWMVGPVEQEWYGEPFRRRLLRSGPVFCEEDLIRAASVIAAADLFVGNDAGVTHLAAALGRPVIALFGPTDSRVWRPLGPSVRMPAPRRRQIDDRFGGLSVADVLACAT